MSVSISRRTFLKLTGAGATLVAGALLLGGGRASVASVRNFEESQDYFPNPERGWHVPIDPDYYNNRTRDHEDPDQPFTPEALRVHRVEGITLVRKYYHLYEYRESDIPRSYLEEHPIYDLNLVREHGLKLIPRFIYVWNVDRFDDDRDASVEWILRHLDQLAPILQENYDVVSHMEMGLVGYYGEWHNSLSGNLGPGPGNESGTWTNPNNGVEHANALNQNSLDIINKVLDVLPQERMALLRFVRHLQQLYLDPLTAQQAYDGADQARLGLHEDSILYNETHRSGYHPDPVARQDERAYQEQVTRYAVMSGEPSGVDSTGFILKSDPFAELGRMHWRSMNNGWYEAVRDGVYDFWKARGAYDEIGYRLGYRFSLVSAGLPEMVNPGGAFGMTFDVKNSGFGAPHNERLLEVVLRHAETKEEHYARVVGSDPRRWLPGETSLVEVKARVPTDMPAGGYDVFLNLPDPEPRLYGRPEYSIRLANDGVWEAFSGYNSVGARVSISGEAVNGGSDAPVFEKRANPPQPRGSEPITLTPAPFEPGLAPVPGLVEEENDVLVGFDDRPAGEAGLTGEYGGIDWGSGGVWRTAEDANGKYAYLNVERNTAEATFTLPQGKVLKSLMILKKERRGSTNEVLLRSGGKEYAWGNPAPWWAHHVLIEDWWDASSKVTLRITSDSPSGAKNIVVTNIVYGDPSPPVVVDFEDLPADTVLTGMHGGIDWGDEEVWRVGTHEDGSKFIYMDKELLPESEWRDKKAYFNLPDGTVLKSMEMRKRAGEDENGGKASFTLTPPEDENPPKPEYGIETYTWIPVGNWHPFGFAYTEPQAKVGIRIESGEATDYDISNVLVGSVTYRQAIRLARQSPNTPTALYETFESPLARRILSNFRQ